MTRRILIWSLPLLLAAMQNAGAMSFGTFDPRSMAMGGAGVAAGTSANASFYNPALLAAARSDEDFSLELPVIGVRLADPDDLIGKLDDYQNAKYEDAMSAAITQWNNASTPAELVAAKNAVITASTNLVNGLSTLSNKALEADVNVGMVVGIPSRHWGTAFYANARAIGGSLLDITQSDLNSVNAVAATLQALDLTGLSDSSANQLTDPTTGFTSSVQAQGAVVTEVGISLAREFTVGESALALGITPKYQSVDTFDYKVDVDTGDVTVDQGKKSYNNVNADIGLAHDFSDGWKAGVVVKNLVSKSYTTALGNSIQIKPQSRLGVAYAGSFVAAALDVDLTKNKGTGFAAKSQYISIGTELNAWDTFQFRLGYRHNLSNSDTDSASLGVGLSPFGVHLDLAVVGSDKEVGVGLQTGFRF